VAVVVTTFVLGVTVSDMMAPEASTFRVAVEVTIVVPSFACTVKVLVPAGVVPLVVVIVSVEAGSLLSTLDGLNVAVVPAGKPAVTERLIFESSLANAPPPPVPVGVTV